MTGGAKAPQITSHTKLQGVSWYTSISGAARDCKLDFGSMGLCVYNFLPCRWSIKFLVPARLAEGLSCWSLLSALQVTSSRTSTLNAPPGQTPLEPL